MPPSALACLELVHSSPGRRRYRILSSGRLDWPLLQSRFTAALRGQSISWRLNPAAKSLLIRHQPASGDIHEDVNAIAAGLRSAHLSVLAALVDLGIEPPATTPVIQIHTRRIHTNPIHGVPLAPLRWLFNGLSSALTLVVLGTAGILFLTGLLGMMVPFTPGSVLLLVAYGLVEIAFLLRRPFVTASVS